MKTIDLFIDNRIFIYKTAGQKDFPLRHQETVVKVWSLKFKTVITIWTKNLYENTKKLSLSLLFLKQKRYLDTNIFDMCVCTNIKVTCRSPANANRERIKNSQNENLKLKLYKTNIFRATCLLLQKTCLLYVNLKFLWFVCWKPENTYLQISDFGNRTQAARFVGQVGNH